MSVNRALWKRSPNSADRPAGQVVDLVTLHASRGLVATRDWCLNHEAKVSYHDIVSERGVLYPIVEYSRVAWANGGRGRSAFAGPPASDGTNARSLTICLINRQDGKSPIPSLQFEVAAAQVARMMQLVPTLRWIVEHSTIATPKHRKADIAPAEPTFDLGVFADRVAHYAGRSLEVVRST